MEPALNEKNPGHASDINDLSLYIPISPEGVQTGFNWIRSSSGAKGEQNIKKTMK